MKITFYIPFYYLLACAVCYWISYFDAVDFNFRLDHSKIDDSSFWKSLTSQTRETWKLLCLDFFKIHCPWSKQTSIKYRVDEAYNMLLNHTHENGWTAEDCRNPENHRQIAHDCFCYRITFWLKALLHFLISPIVLVLQIVVSIIATVALTFAVLYKFVFSR